MEGLQTREVSHPAGVALTGRWARAEPLDTELHGMDLHQALCGEDSLWDFMAAGPFPGVSPWLRWLRDRETSRDPVFLAIRDGESGHAGAMAAFMRIEPAHRVIEIGHICIGPALQNSRIATEALVLMMGWAFAAGFRRCEWKCDARNLASRRAAQRLGFSFEGLFRQHMIIKGRNRDTAWFSVTDGEWPALNEVFRQWLAPANFTGDGGQILRLSELTRPLIARRDPELIARDGI